MRITAFPLLLLALAAGLAACEREPGPAEVEHAREADEARIEVPPPVAENPAPREIYHDLTAFEWYRQGRPLLVEGRPYQPAGLPEATRLRRFQRAGEYEGVAYYVPEGTQRPFGAVYLPVSPGYWQPFAPTQ